MLDKGSITDAEAALRHVRPCLALFMGPPGLDKLPRPFQVLRP